MKPDQRDYLKFNIKQLINEADGDGIIVTDDPDNLAEQIVQMLEEEGL